MAKAEDQGVGERVLFAVAIAFALIAVASVVWVLSAPATVDDQGTRATLAGWGVAVLAAVLSAAAAFVALRRGSREQPQPERPSATFTQNISGGTGNIGGVHFHGDVHESDG